jgi:hypothetical protein
MASSFSLTVFWNLGTSVTKLSNCPFKVTAFVSAEVTSNTRSAAIYLGSVCLVLAIVFLIGLVPYVICYLVAALHASTIISFKCEIPIHSISCTFLISLLDRYHAHPVFRSAAPNLLIVFLIGVVVFCIGLILRGISPTDSLCTGSPWLLTLGFLIQNGSIFAKAYRIQAIFGSKSLQVVNLSDLELCGYVAVIVGVGFFLHLIKYFTDPYVVAISSMASNSFLTFHTCNTGSSIIWPIVLYGYQAVLIIFGIVMAFRTRKVPGKFNESNLIAVVIFNTGFISVLALAVSYVLQSTGPTPVFYIETIGLAYGVLFALLVIFAPKFRLVLREPKMEDTPDVPAVSGAEGSQAGSQMGASVKRTGTVRSNASRTKTLRSGSVGASARDNESNVELSPLLRNRGMFISNSCLNSPNYICFC